MEQPARLSADDTAPLYQAPPCVWCNGYLEVDDPSHPGRDADPFTPAGMPCPVCA